MTPAAVKKENEKQTKTTKKAGASPIKKTAAK